MRMLDFTPLFRSTVGFDHLARTLDTVSRLDEQAVAYPPYNIEKFDENSYRITMAIAGFSIDDVTITFQNRTLLVSGEVKKDSEKVEYLHRGIAGRPFERRFELADHIKVTDARMDNGLLYIDLVREIPEEMKPRSIPISSTLKSQKTLSSSKAA